MSELPLITLVTPSLQQDAFLEETIRSVLGQNYPHLEYFVMDGGSTDGSVEILRRYADRLTGWVSEPDGGHADAVNKGLSRGTGEVLGFLNSDDVFFPNALERVGTFFRDHPDVAWATGGCRFFSDEPLDDDCPHQLETWFPRDDLTALDFLEGCPLPQPSTFFRRRVFERVGLFSGRIASLDYEYWLRMWAAGCRPRVLREVLSGWRLHAGAQSVAAFEKNIEGNMAVSLEFLPKFISGEAQMAKARRRLEGVFALYHSAASLRCSNKLNAFRLAVGGGWRAPSLLRRKATWAALLRATLPAFMWRPLLRSIHRRRGIGTDPRALQVRPFRPATN